MPPAAANEKEGNELGHLGAEPRRPRQKGLRPLCTPLLKSYKKSHLTVGLADSEYHGFVGNRSFSGRNRAVGV